MTVKQFRKIKFDFKAKRKVSSYESLALASLRESVYSVDINGYCTFINQTALSLLGFRFDEVIGQKPCQLFYAYVEDPLNFFVESPCYQTILDGARRESENIFRRKDSELFPAHLTIAPIRNEDKTVGAVVVFRDLTQYKVSEQSSAKFENILNQTLDCIYMFTSETLLFVYVNQGARKLVGYNEDEVLRITLLDIMTEFDEADFRQMRNLLIDGTQSSYNFEAVLNHKDGYPVLVEIHLKWVKLTFNESYFVAIVRDITERKTAERSIGYLSRIYTALAQSNQAIVRCKDEVTLFNEVCQIAVEFGGMKMSWIGRLEEASGLIRPIAAFRENHPVIIQDFGTDERASPWHERALSFAWGASAAFPLLRGGLSYAVLTVYHEDSEIFDQRMVDLLKEVAIDISYALDRLDLATERQQAKEAKNEAEAANKMKSSFLANMSHEIRTPLNSILGFANILFEEEKEPGKLEKLEIVKNSGSHLLNLVNNILEFSKIEAGMVEIEQRSFSIRKLLENLKQMFILKSQELHLSWEVDIDPSVPEIIVGDEHRLTQVLVNLTGNAFKFTEFGGVSIHVSYLNGQLEILVKDTGIGIPEAKQEAIFSAFEQVDTSHARKYGGTGLGLSITRNLLDLMGGGNYS